MCSSMPSLALVIEHLKRKAAPFRVIDTHAGAGRYALAPTEAAKTGEWRDGIGRLLGPDAKPLPPPSPRCLRPISMRCARRTRAPRSRSIPAARCLALRLMRARTGWSPTSCTPRSSAQLEAAIGARRPRQGDGARRLAGAQVAAAAQGAARRRADRPAVRGGARAASGWHGACGGTRSASPPASIIAWYPIKDAKPIARFHQAVAALALRQAARASSCWSAGRAIRTGSTAAGC